MKTTKVLQTNVSQTNIGEVSNILNTSSGNRVAICNANTLVRGIRKPHIGDLINNFTIKTPDGFPVAKALSIMNEKKITSLCVYKNPYKKKIIGIIHIHNLLKANIS